MHWTFYTIIVVLGATGIHFFSKLGKGLMDPFVALVYTMAAALVTALVFLPAAKESIWTSEVMSKGALYYALVGVCLAVAHLGIFYMFKAGGPISIATPLARLGPVLVAVVLGVLVFQEVLKPVQILGLVLAVTGVVLTVR